MGELWGICESLRSRASLGAGRERAGREREGSLRDRCGRVVGELRTSRIIIGCHWIILHLSFDCLAEGGGFRQLPFAIVAEGML